MADTQEDAEEDTTDPIAWQFERQSQRVKSLPIEAQLELQRRIDECKAVRDAAIRVYSRYWQARGGAERRSRGLIKAQDPALLVSLVVGLVAFVLGFRVGAVLFVVAALVGLAVLGYLQSERESNALKPLVVQIEELKGKWVAAGGSADNLDTFGLTLLDHSNERVRPACAREFSVWWNQVESRLTDIVERAIRHPVQERPAG